MPLIDFTKKDEHGNPTVVDGRTPVEVPVVEQALYDDDPPESDSGEEIAAGNPPQIDCSTVPDGRWGIDKIHAWFHDNGLPTSHTATKEDLIAEAKQRCAEQETT